MLDSVPQKVMSTWNPRMLSYLEKVSLQIHLVKTRHNALGWAVKPMAVSLQEGGGNIQRPTVKMAMRQGRQSLELCCLQSRNAKESWKPPEAKKEILPENLPKKSEINHTHTSLLNLWPHEL